MRRWGVRQIVIAVTRRRDRRARPAPGRAPDRRGPRRRGRARPARRSAAIRDPAAGAALAALRAGAGPPRRGRGACATCRARRGALPRRCWSRRRRHLARAHEADAADAALAAAIEAGDAGAGAAPRPRPARRGARAGPTSRSRHWRARPRSRRGRPSRGQPRPGPRPARRRAGSPRPSACAAPLLAAAPEGPRPRPSSPGSPRTPATRSRRRRAGTPRCWPTRARPASLLGLAPGADGPAPLRRGAGAPGGAGRIATPTEPSRWRPSSAPCWPRATSPRPSARAPALAGAGTAAWSTACCSRACCEAAADDAGAAASTCRARGRGAAGPGAAPRRRPSLPPARATSRPPRRSSRRCSRMAPAQLDALLGLAERAGRARAGGGGRRGRGRGGAPRAEPAAGPPRPGTVAETLGRLDAARLALLEARSALPWRVEPLLQLAQLALRHGQRRGRGGHGAALIAAHPRHLARPPYRVRRAMAAGHGRARRARSWRRSSRAAAHREVAAAPGAAGLAGRRGRARAGALAPDHAPRPAHPWRAGPDRAARRASAARPRGRDPRLPAGAQRADPPALAPGYYRGLGVDRFLVLDNGSDDGTREWLLAQGAGRPPVPHRGLVRRLRCGDALDQPAARRARQRSPGA